MSKSECPTEVDFYTLDTIAECFDVSVWLYRKLWDLTSEFEKAGTAQPIGGDGSNGTTEEPIVGGDYSNLLGKAWHRFSAEEQKEILKALHRLIGVT